MEKKIQRKARGPESGLARLKTEQRNVLCVKIITILCNKEHIFNILYEVWLHERDEHKLNVLLTQNFPSK